MVRRAVVTLSFKLAKLYPIVSISLVHAKASVRVHVFDRKVIIIDKFFFRAVVLTARLKEKVQLQQR